MFEVMAKRVYLYKYAKDLYAQLVSAEEGLEDEYFDNDRFVSLDDLSKGDRRKVLQEYHVKLAQFDKAWRYEWDRLVTRGAYCMLSNLTKRKFGCERSLSQSLNLTLGENMQQHVTEAQAALNSLQDRLGVIKSYELRTYFSVQAGLDRCLDEISDDIHSVGSNELSHRELVAIADRTDCEVGCDLRRA